MKTRIYTLVVCLFVAPFLHAQLFQNTVTIIPTVNTSTGAPTAPGTIVYRDTTATPKTLTFSIPTSLTNSYTVTWPQKPSASGCLDMSATGVLSVDPTCTGASGSGLWLNSGANPNNVFLASTSYSVQNLPIQDQTASTGATVFTVTAGANQCGGGTTDLLTFYDNSSVKLWNVDCSGNLVPHNGTLTVGSATTSFNIGYFTTTNTTQVAFNGSVGLDMRIGVDSSGSKLNVTTPTAVTIWQFVGGAGASNISYVDLIPGVTNSQNLGEPSLYWNNGYINNLHVNSCTGCTLYWTLDSSNDLSPSSGSYTLTGVNFQNQVASTGATVTTIKAGAAQCTAPTDLLGIYNNSGTKLWDVDCNGNIAPHTGTLTVGTATNSFNVGYFTTANVQSVVWNGATGIGMKSGMDAGNINLNITTPTNVTIWQFSGGATPTNISYVDLTPNATNTLNLGESSLYWNNGYINHLFVTTCTGCPGGVTSVTATSPIASSGGTTPVISCATCLTTSSLSGTSPITYTSGVIACANCVTTNTSQTVSGTKTFSGGITMSSGVGFAADNTYSIGSGAAAANTIYSYVHQGNATGATCAFLTGGSTFCVTGSGIVQATTAYQVGASHLNAINSIAEFIGNGGVATSGAISTSSTLGVGSTSNFTGQATFNSGLLVLGEVQPNSTNTYNLGDSSHVWSNIYGSTVNVSSALGGTFNMSGAMTVTGNFYLRTFSGTPSCAGVANGWVGYDTTGNHIWVCNGGVAQSH